MKFSGFFKKTLSIIFIGIFFSAALVQAAEKEITLEELAKTEAAKFFVRKQYSESLKAFLELENEYPENILIKRYIAALYDSLQQRDRAIQKLEEVITLAPEDWISRQMQGDLYLKQGKFDEAEKDYQEILKGSGEESSSGKYAKQKIESIEKLRNAPKPESGKQMSAPEFMRSVPAQDFAQGRYEKALEGFEGLLKIYPEDPLVHRFKGIALQRLKRSNEAIMAFQEGLQNNPENAALHFYLGDSYAQANNSEAARKEFQWIIANEKGPYLLRAKRALFQTLGGFKIKPPKPWTLTINNGWEYDTNATYKSRDEDFSQAGDQNSSRFNTNTFGTYRFYQKNKWFFTADALYAQSLYTAFPNIQTYTWGSGVSALTVLNIFGKTAYLNIRDGITQTFLKNKFFVFTQTLSPTFIFNWNEHIRSNVGYRFGVNQYENRGSFPEFTNRSGLSNGFSVSSTYYFDSQQKKFFTVGYDFDYERTKGLDYVKRANTGRLEFQWVLPKKIEFNFNFRFKDSYFPKYASGPPDRWDHQFTLTPSLSRQVFWEWLFLTLSYTYEATPARYNAYEYFKHVFGVQLSIRL